MKNCAQFLASLAKMAGIHLPDIGKLGIRIATGIRDKKKVAPSNMAENARFQALATRLDSEKHERSRVLKKEERRMKRKKHRIDKRRQDIQKNKKQDINTDVDSNDRKRFLPLISHPKTVTANDSKDDLLSEDWKDLDQYSGGPTSAIFPIQDEISRLLDSGNEGNRQSEKRKVILPSIETGLVDRNTKHRKTASLNKTSKKNGSIKDNNKNSLERSFAESNVCRDKQVVLSSPEETISQEVHNSTELKGELEADTKVSSQAKKKEPQIENETHEQIINVSGFSIDESQLSANPFNYLLLQQQRKKALNQNLEDAFRAIKTCRYIRTPSRREKEKDDE